MLGKHGEKASKETRSPFCRFMSYENSLQNSTHNVKYKNIIFKIMIFKVYSKNFILKNFTNLIS